MENQSFDLDIMMPPDVASIDSDLSKFPNFWCVTVYLNLLLLDKLSALTPQPLMKNDYSMGIGYENQSYAGATAMRFDLGS
jgi:hypothetical protein